jgi:N-acetylglucosamine transport system substrate-binding protein
MRVPLSILITVVTVSLLLAGCDVLVPLPGTGETGRRLEVAVFEGGYGIDWHQGMAAAYNKEVAPPDLTVDLWGAPRVIEIVKPRLLRGDPPDLLLMNHLPIWQLVAADRLVAFDDVLDGPAYGSDQTWRDLFVPGTLNTYTANGKVYGIPSAFGAWSCWYDARLFREHGWEVPETWAEFDALCREMRAAGIAPVAFQGKYPIYALWTFISLVHRVGGLEAINRINALDPEAFRHPDVVRAAGLMQDLAQDHFQRGALAMTHTESQLQFVTNKAGLIFCGLWLYNEMKDSIPPGFEMRCFNVPRVEGGKGNPNLFNGFGTEFLYVPAESRYPEAAKDFTRFLVSPENAPSMGSEIGVISPLRDATPKDGVPPALQSALEMIGSAEGIFNERLSELLLEWNFEVLRPNLARLLRGEITPTDFGAALDAGVAKAAANPRQIIPNAVAYDPGAFGEPGVEP